MSSYVLDVKLDVFLEECCDLDQMKVVLKFSFHGLLIWFVVVLLDSDIEGQSHVLELGLTQLFFDNVCLL